MHPNLSRDHYFALGINPSATAAEIILAAEHQTVKTEDACHALLQIRNHQEQISAKGPEFNHQNILSSALAVLNVIAKDDTISTETHNQTVVLPSDLECGHDVMKRAPALNVPGEDNVNIAPPANGGCQPPRKTLNRDTSTFVKTGTMQSMFSNPLAGTKSTLVSCEVSPAGPDDNFDSLPSRNGLDSPHETFKLSLTSENSCGFDMIPLWRKLLEAAYEHVKFFLPRRDNATPRDLSPLPEKGSTAYDEIQLPIQEEDVPEGVSIRDILKRSRGNFYRRSVFDIFPRKTQYSEPKLYSQ
ncbi:hypothetical protein HDK90DRAFT_471041 [Phyllosticta capitalensis]|uniref:Uncharacterized protein n=1 Tax=Phyllosticta capitalensis TaxID=121624 RepID=A0ABR1Y9R4_9PEZI